jgi:spore germination cell wall hydrolase CwlJ-like protein
MTSLSKTRSLKAQLRAASCAGDPVRLDRWLSVNFTGRSLAAAGALSVCVLLTALSATAAVERAEDMRAQQSALANQAELAAGLADFLAAETQGAREALSSPSLKPARSMASVVESDGALEMADFNLADIQQAQFLAGERKCLAEAIYYEARSESRVGQMAVADVVLNRVKSRVYPDTICGVVYQGSERRTGCQFSFTCDGSMKRRVDQKRMRAADELAGAVLAGVRAPVTHNATHYHADYVTPVWAGSMTKTTTIGTHIFYKFSPRQTPVLASAGI